MDLSFPEAQSFQCVHQAFILADDRSLAAITVDWGSGDRTADPLITGLNSLSHCCPHPLTQEACFWTVG